MATAATAPPRSTRARYLQAGGILLVAAVVEIALLRLAGALLDRYWELGPVPADTEILLWLRQGYAKRVHEVMEQLSAVGSKTVLILVVVLAMIATTLGRFYHVAVMMALSAGGAALLNLA